MGQSHPECQRLLTIPGVGPLTATALVAALSDAEQCNNGRQFAAWLGPAAAYHRGKERLLEMSKRGDCYVRKLLVHGARATAQWVGRKMDRHNEPMGLDLCLGLRHSPRPRHAFAASDYPV